MKLYIVRHGETIFNKKGKIQGWCDSPLSEKGIRQAECVGYGLRNVPFVCACSSTSERAYDTCELIMGKRGIEHIARKTLKEVNFGELEGETMGSEFMEAFVSPDGFRKYGGETFEEAGKRVVRTLEEIAKEHPEGNVLAVLHGAVILAALSEIEPDILNRVPEGKAPENCSVTILDYTNGVFTIEDFCDSSYRMEGEARFGQE